MYLSQFINSLLFPTSSGVDLQVVKKIFDIELSSSQRNYSQTNCWSDTLRHLNYKIQSTPLIKHSSGQDTFGLVKRVGLLTEGRLFLNNLS